MLATVSSVSATTLLIGSQVRVQVAGETDVFVKVNWNSWYASKFGFVEDSSVVGGVLIREGRGLTRETAQVPSPGMIASAGMTQAWGPSSAWQQRGQQPAPFPPDPICHCGSYKSEHYPSGIDDHSFSEMEEETPESRADEIVAQLLDDRALRAALLVKEPALRSLIEAIAALSPAPK